MKMTIFYIFQAEVIKHRENSDSEHTAERAGNSQLFKVEGEISTAPTTPTATASTATITTMSEDISKTYDLESRSTTDLTDSMVLEPEFSQAVMLNEFIKIRKDHYNNIFYDELHLLSKQHNFEISEGKSSECGEEDDVPFDQQFKPNGERADGKSCAFYLHELTTLNIIHVWIALHKDASNRYLGYRERRYTNVQNMDDTSTEDTKIIGYKEYSNFTKFRATFQEPELNLNLRNPALIQEQSIRHLDKDLKEQQARIPPKLIDGIPPKIVEIPGLKSTPIKEENDVSNKLVKEIEDYFKHYTERIVLMLPSTQTDIRTNILKKVVKKLISKFPNVNFFGLCSQRDHDKMVTEINKELTSIATDAPPSFPSTSTTLIQNAISLDVNEFLDKKGNVILITDHHMMEGDEATTIISLFTNTKSYMAHIVANQSETNYSCRCTAKLIVFKKVDEA